MLTNKLSAARRVYTAVMRVLLLLAAYVSGIPFQCHHPVRTTENACRTIVVNEESLWSLCRLNTFLLEKTRIRSITIAYQT